MLEGKVVWITGATSGVGAETARQLTARGAIAIVTGRREDKLREVSAALPAERHRCYKMDVCNNDDIAVVFEQIMHEYGRVDVLVNNAGFGQFAYFEDTALEQFAAMMDTNYMGLIRCTKMVLPVMKQRGEGQIVNVASMAGKLSTAKASGYAATKHAVLGLTNALRFELQRYNITVSAVNPGPIDTPFLDQADGSGQYRASVGSYLLRPEQVAAAVIRIIERRLPELDLPRSAGLGVKLYGLAPRLADRLVGRFLNRK